MEKDGNSIWATKTKWNYTLLIYILHRLKK